MDEDLGHTKAGCHPQLLAGGSWNQDPPPVGSHLPLQRVGYSHTMGGAPGRVSPADHGGLSLGTVPRMTGTDLNRDAASMPRAGRRWKGVATV